MDIVKDYLRTSIVREERYILRLLKIRKLEKHQAGQWEGRTTDDVGLFSDDYFFSGINFVIDDKYLNCSFRIGDRRILSEDKRETA